MSLIAKYRLDFRDLHLMAEMTDRCAGDSPKGKECSWTYIGGVSNIKSPPSTFACCSNGNALDLHREYHLSALKIDRSAAKTAQWSRMIYDPIYMLTPATQEDQERTAKLTEELKEFVKDHHLPPPGLLNIPENPTIQPTSKPSVTPELAGFTRVPMTGFKTTQGIRGKTADVVIYDEVQDLPKEESFDFDRYNGVKK
jgi:hypothetical protein